MGSMDIIKPLSTVLSSTVNKSKQSVKNYWEHRESNRGLLCEKQVCYLCTMLPSFKWEGWWLRADKKDLIESDSSEKDEDDGIAGLKSGGGIAQR